MFDSTSTANLVDENIKRNLKKWRDLPLSNWIAAVHVGTFVVFPVFNEWRLALFQLDFGLEAYDPSLSNVLITLMNTVEVMGMICRQLVALLNPSCTLESLTKFKETLEILLSRLGLLSALEAARNSVMERYDLNGKLRSQGVRRKESDRSEDFDELDPEDSAVRQDGRALGRRQ